MNEAGRRGKRLAPLRQSSILPMAAPGDPVAAVLGAASMRSALREIAATAHEMKPEQREVVISLLAKAGVDTERLDAAESATGRYQGLRTGSLHWAQVMDDGDQGCAIDEALDTAQLAWAACVT